MVDIATAHFNQADLVLSVVGTRKKIEYRNGTTIRVFLMELKRKTTISTMRPTAVIITKTQT